MGVRWKGWCGEDNLGTFFGRGFSAEPRLEIEISGLWYPAKVFIFVGPSGAIRLNPIKIILFHQQYRPLPFRIRARHAYRVPLPPDIPPDPAQLCLQQHPQH